MRPAPISETAGGARPLIMALALALGLGPGAAAGAAAGSYCFVSGTVCEEAGGTRLVNGVRVTRDCWAEREVWTCLTPDEGVDGCATLAAAAGEGICQRYFYACDGAVSAADGQSFCAAERERWQCSSQIELPSLNAEWLGQSEAREREVDYSACADLEADATCVRDELSCDETGDCRQDYLCGALRLTGCSVLAAGGCREVAAPSCPEEGPDCDVRSGLYSCEDGLPDGALEAGAEVVGEDSTVLGAPAADASSCAELDARCQLSATSCVDPGGLRAMNGGVYYSDCWEYRRDYLCPGEEDSSCAALEAISSCVLEDSSCADDPCSETVRTYLCQGDASTVPAGSAELLENLSTSLGQVTVSDCAELAARDDCALTRSACQADSDAGCLTRTVTYSCGRGEVALDDGCAAFAADSSCQETSSECLGRDDDGSCSLTTRVYTCQRDAGSVELTTCDSQVCLAGLCQSSGQELSGDLANALGLLEVARQAAVYGEIGDDRLFAGESSGCSVKAAGFSCCRAVNAEESVRYGNSSLAVSYTLIGQAAWEGIKFAGSPLVYDMLSSSEKTSGLLDWLYGDALSGAYTPSLSWYGISVSLSGGSLTLSFSPASFIVSAALDLAQEYFSCSAEDQLHALRRSQDLCHYVGSWCAQKGGAACLEKKERWCCFNSRLALVVQEQGRAQLGLGWGEPEDPDCRGLTVAEFESLDFSRMDLTAVIAEIAAQASDLSSGAVSGTIERATERLSGVAADGSTLYTEVDSIDGKVAGQSADAAEDE